MSEIEMMEQKLKKHIVFFYNNIKLGDDSIIDNNSVEELYKVFQNLRKYDKLNMVIQTGGGNLASGTRLISILKELYTEYEVTVLNRCHSTGTYIALAADSITVTPKSLITPCEPQMIFDDSNISISVIRNILENKDNINEVMELLSPKVIGEYFSTINYFKDICNQVYSKERATKIINYMLNKVNSHQYPLSLSELKDLGIVINQLKNSDECNFYFEQENILLKEFSALKKGNYKQSRITLIKDNNSTRAYCKEYQKKLGKYRKTFEGYKTI